MISYTTLRANIFSHDSSIKSVGSVFPSLNLAQKCKKAYHLSLTDWTKRICSPFGLSLSQLRSGFIVQIARKLIVLSRSVK